MLIILVVFGHILNVEHVFTYGVKAVITAFHIPAFFVIAGIITKADDLRNIFLKRFMIKKVYRLVVPYIFFEMTGGLWQMLLMRGNKVNINGIVYGIFTIHCHVGADWFLPTIFFSEICLYVLIRVCKREAYPFISIVCMVVALAISDTTYLVACCRRILIALAFMLTGISFKEHLTKKNVMALVTSAIATIIIAYFNGIVDLATRQFGNPVLYILGSIVGTYSILCFSQYVTGILAHWLVRVGRSSLIIMGTHQNVQVAVNVRYGSVYSLPLQMTFLYEIITVTLYEKYIPFFVGSQYKTVQTEKQSEGK